MEELERNWIDMPPAARLRLRAMYLAGETGNPMPPPSVSNKVLKARGYVTEHNRLTKAGKEIAAANVDNPRDTFWIDAEAKS